MRMSNGSTGYILVDGLNINGNETDVIDLRKKVDFLSQRLTLAKKSVL